MSGCSILKQIEYKEKNDRKGYYRHWKVYIYNGILDYKKWYKHQAEPITEVKEAYILWDFAIQTDRKIKSHRPDIVIKEYKRKAWVLIDMSGPTNNNISVKK